MVFLHSVHLPLYKTCICHHVQLLNDCFSTPNDPSLSFSPTFFICTLTPSGDTNTSALRKVKHCPLDDLISQTTLQDLSTHYRLLLCWYHPSVHSHIHRLHPNHIRLITTSHPRRNKILFSSFKSKRKQRTNILLPDSRSCCLPDTCVCPWLLNPEHSSGSHHNLNHRRQMCSFIFRIHGSLNDSIILQKIQWCVSGSRIDSGLRS